MQNHIIELNKALSNLNHDIITSMLKNNMEIKENMVDVMNNQLNSIRNNLEVKLINDELVVDEIYDDSEAMEVVALLRDKIQNNN